MGGLLLWIKAKVEFCEQLRLSQMMILAQMVENREILRKEANLPRYSRAKFPNYPSTNAKTNTVINGNDNKGNTIFPIRTITLRGTATGEIQKEGTSKRLSDAEFQTRKEKGLCFQCNEKYSADHRCKPKEQRELWMFVVKPNNEEWEFIEAIPEESKELNALELAVDGNACVELPINSVVGLTNPRTMKIHGRIQGKEIVVLIDCGATHNFISEKLVNEL